MRAPVAITTASNDAQLLDGDVAADVDAEAELDALGRELLDPALDDPLLDLEVRNAEADEPAACLVALEHGHRVPGARELLRARHARRPGADHGDRPSGLATAAAAARPSPRPRRG